MTSAHASEDTSIGKSDQRIVVVGTSGSGKTTTGRELGLRLGVPHVELDALNWDPNWRSLAEHDVEKFRRRVIASTEGDAWIVDGNYGGAARQVVWPRATTIVWLDYPVYVPLWRVFRRVLRRGIRREKLWNGNVERMWEHFLTTDSLFLWVLKTHWLRRRTIPEVLLQPEHAHLRLLRFKSPRATRRWLAAVAKPSSSGAES